MFSRVILHLYTLCLRNTNKTERQYEVPGGDQYNVAAPEPAVTSSTECLGTHTASSSAAPEAGHVARIMEKLRRNQSAGSDSAQVVQRALLGQHQHRQQQ